MRHFISVSTVCHFTHLGVSSPRRVMTVVLPSDIKCEQERWLQMLFFFLLCKVSRSPTDNTYVPAASVVCDQRCLFDKRMKIVLLLGQKHLRKPRVLHSNHGRIQKGVRTPCPPLDPPMPTPLVPKAFLKYRKQMQSSRQYNIFM